MSYERSMRVNRSLLLICLILVPFLGYEACFRSWCLYRHWRVRAAGGSVRVRWGVESGSRPAIFDEPATAGCWIWLDGTAVNDANISMLGCYDDLLVLDLSQTKVTLRGIASLPNMHVHRLVLRGDSLGDAGEHFLENFSGIGRLDLVETGVTDRIGPIFRSLVRLATWTFRGLTCRTALSHTSSGRGTLSSVILARTRVTQGGVDKLRSARPDLAVYFEPGAWPRGSGSSTAGARPGVGPELPIKNREIH